MKRLLWLTIILFWLLSMGGLVKRHYLSSADSKGLPTELLGKRWFSISKDGQKIGWLSSDIEATKGGYRATESVFMRLKLLGVPKELSTILETYLDPSGSLKEFSFILNSDMTLKVDGVIEGKTLSAEIDIGGVRTKQNIPLRDTPSLGLHLLPEIKGSEPIKIPIIEPSTLVETVVELRVVGEEEIEIMGKKQNAIKLIGSSRAIGSIKGEDGAITIWATPKGEVLKEQYMGFTFLREEKDEALSLGLPTYDITESASIKPIGNVPAKEDLSYLRVRLSGVELSRYDLDGSPQRLIGDILEVYRSEIPSDKKDYPQEEDYLSPSIFIQSDDPEVKGFALEITKDALDDIQKTRFIYDELYRNIKKTPATTLPSAKEVLRTRRGDCNEHTVLFVALSRAVGIPSRTAIGLIYKDGAFYYHAWPEVYLRGRWIGIDPTIGEFPAGAGRIRLLIGDIDTQFRIISLLGRLSIEIIDSR